MSLSVAPAASSFDQHLGDWRRDHRLAQRGGWASTRAGGGRRTFAWAVSDGRRMSMRLVALSLGTIRLCPPESWRMGVGEVVRLGNYGHKVGWWLKRVGCT